MTIMAWSGVDRGLSAVKSGYSVIQNPGQYCYLDTYQSDPAAEPRAICGYLTLRKVYSYNPVPSELSLGEASHIIGVQWNLWTEFIPDEATAEFRAFPRVLAASEVAWSRQQSKSWGSFKRRVSIHLKKLDALGVRYCRASAETTFWTDLKVKYLRKKFL
jgi:hexosaminidase